MKKNTNKLALFLIYLLNLFLYVNTQIDDEPTLKALTCVSIVSQHLGAGEGEYNSYSQNVLSCYIKITIEQARKVLTGIEDEIEPLDQEEIDALLDTEDLKDFSDNEIKKKTKELEKTIEKLEKLNENFAKLYEDDEMVDNDDDGDDDGDDEYDDDYGDGDDEYGIRRKKRVS